MLVRLRIFSMLGIAAVAVEAEARYSPIDGGRYPTFPPPPKAAGPMYREMMPDWSSRPFDPRAQIGRASNRSTRESVGSGAALP